MKKRILTISILLVLCMVCLLCLNACNGANGSQNGQNQPDSSGSQDQSGGDSGDGDLGDNDSEDITIMYITINGNKLKVELCNNSSVDALLNILKGGNITYTADDYGDFEKVGSIGHTLPRNDTQITTQPGDVILYQGSNICLYYDVNTWSFTRIGRINGYSASELRELLGAGLGQMQVTISLS